MGFAAMERGLAAILAADVVGYSRLMGEDETGTLQALNAHRHEVFKPEIEAHHGRIVKTMGERNAGIAEDKRIAFRISINLGDVIVEDGDIYGDGVKNIARPVRIFSVPMAQFAAPAAPAVRAAEADDGGLALPDLSSIAVLPFDNMNRGLEDIFAIQDEITETIVGALVGKLHQTARHRAMNKTPGSLETYDYFLRGYDLFLRLTREDREEARQMLQRALALDPNYARAYGLLAWRSPYGRVHGMERGHGPVAGAAAGDGTKGAGPRFLRQLEALGRGRRLPVSARARALAGGVPKSAGAQAQRCRRDGQLRPAL